MIIKKWIYKLLEIGVNEHISRQEAKNIRLLNFCSIAWIIINLLFIVEDIYVHSPDLTHSLVFLSTILVIIGIMFFQKMYYHLVAKTMFIVLSFVHYLIFAIYLEPGAFLEYLLLLIPIFSIIFFNNRPLSLAVLLVSYICFIVTMKSFGYYKYNTILYTANLALFIAVYIPFLYFKESNIRSEKSLENQRQQLEEQRDKAIVANAKIEQQRKELEELNRFQSHFWINLSHEIRTPLTLIKGSASKLKTEKHFEKLLDHYKRIEDNSDKIHVLIDNIMDLSKMKSNKLEINCKPINLNEFCKKIMHSFEPLFTQKSINYSFCNSLIDLGITCKIDGLFIERALGNLLLNASNYTPKHGKIEVSLQSKDKEVSIIVKDSGCGIPKKELPFIFDAFYRANNAMNKSGGTGVGLSFTKEVIELHNGRIAVKSEENKGAEFTITLPIYYIGSVYEELLDVLPNTKSISNNVKILLVEDNKDMRKYIREVLTDYHVMEASAGNEALNILSEATPDLIITDYMMPEMNGYEFVENIRKTGCDIPVIVITARVDKEAKIDFLRLGLDDYLTKPFNEEELLIRVAHSVNNNKERVQFNQSHNDILLIKHKKLNKIQSIIESHMKSLSFGVIELADILAISERTLYRKIKSWCGLTPNEFIREVKLQKALVYYNESEVNSLKELAAEVGFTNSSHLAKLFKKRFGTKLDFKIR